MEVRVSTGEYRTYLTKWICSFIPQAAAYLRSVAIDGECISLCHTGDKPRDRWGFGTHAPGYFCLGGRLPISRSKDSSIITRILAGEVPRGRAGEITGYGERMARNVVSDLVKKGYLKSAGTRAPLVLSFPIDAVERWFPGLYPAI